MSAIALVTLIGVGLLVVALAAYLIAVIRILQHVRFTLGTIIVGVRAIALQVEPVNPIVGEINGDLTELQGALDGLLAKKAAAASASSEGTMAGDDVVRS